mmetsp:Transcript_9307/g.14687  ORF Transcript_9307/g.14687 Transcript_9307/m.14687 type:complete len:112 (+) Transcript_9307:217-552(+)
MMFAPRWALDDMFVVDDKDFATNEVLQLMTRWCGLFFFALAVSTGWISLQPPSANMRSLHFVSGLIWLFDSLFIKFVHFTPSGIVQAKDSSIAGVVDFGVGLAHLYLSQNY